MRSSVEVELGIYDLEAKDDAEVLCNTVQPFADLGVFTRERATPRKTATLEPGRFVLDGSMDVFPDEMDSVEWGLWSSGMSDADGRFAEPVVLEFRFKKEHASVGLTLYFDEAVGEKAGDTLVEWFGAGGNRLAQVRTMAGGPVWNLHKQVERYTRVRICFYGTDRPYRYLKMAGIDFGARAVFGPGEIQAARVLEGLDPSGSELYSAQLELDVYVEDEAFNILNPEGVFYGLRQRQKLTVRGMLDGQEMAFGDYYLAEWESTGEKTARFVATDVIGLLVNTEYLGGIYDTTAGELADEILEGFPYRMEEALRAVAVEGWLPIGTKREALQQLAFAVGGVVDTSRDGVIKIYRLDGEVAGHIARDRKLLGRSTVKLKPLVTGVRVLAYTYTKGRPQEELFRAKLRPQVLAIHLEEPAYDIEHAMATVLFRHPNKMELLVAAEHEVILMGNKYAHGTIAYTSYPASLPLRAGQNMLVVENATLVSPALGRDVSERVLRYHARRYEQRFTMRLGSERLADTVLVSSFSGETLLGEIESMEIDLAGGFIAELVVCGERVIVQEAANMDGQEPARGGLPC